MLERYVEGFDADAFLESYAKKEGLPKKAALQRLRGIIPLERRFQTRIIDALRKRYPDAFVAKLAQGIYSRVGIPDIVCIYRGHYFGFEVKRPVVGAASGVQEATMREIRKAGGTAAVVSWAEECFRIIDEWEETRNAKE